VGELEVVRHGFHREAGASLRRDVVAHVAWLDRTERSPSEEGPEMPPQHDPVVLNCRALALHDLLEVPEVLRGRDFKGQLPVRWRRDGLGHQLSEACLGLLACETVWLGG
jgi:hypothetical protein